MAAYGRSTSYRGQTYSSDSYDIYELREFGEKSRLSVFHVVSPRSVDCVISRVNAKVTFMLSRLSGMENSEEYRVRPVKNEVVELIGMIMLI